MGTAFSRCLLPSLLVLGAGAQEALKQQIWDQQHEINLAQGQRGLNTQAPVRLQLKRIAPSDFERLRQAWSSTQKTAALLMCTLSHSPCDQAESRLAEAAAWLAAERLPVAAHVLDTSEWGGQQLRQELVGPGSSPAIVILHGAPGAPVHIYDGNLRLEAIGHAVRSLLRGATPLHSSVEAANEERTMHRLTREVPADTVVDLHNRSMARAMVEHHPLVFVLLYPSEQQLTALHANYSVAAKLLFEHSIDARLTRLEVRAGDPHSSAFVRELDVTELPDLVLFRHGRACAYEAGSSPADLFDVARWNAAFLSRARLTGTEVESAAHLEELLHRHSLLLITFSPRWCARCLGHLAENDAAARPLMQQDPPIPVAHVNIDVEANRLLVERYEIAIFPIAKVIHRGRCIGDLSGSLLAHEVVIEMLSIRDDLTKAEIAAHSQMRLEQKGSRL